MANQSPAFPEYPQGLAPPPGAPPQYELGSNRYSNSSPPQPTGLARNDMEGCRPSVEKPAPGAPAGAQQWQQAHNGAGAGAQAHMAAAVPALTAPPGAPVADPFQPSVTPNQAGEDSSEAAYYNAQRCLMVRLGESIIGRAYESPRDCKAGLLRNTVCATNLRLILNTHFRFLCMAKRDFHESVFYECIYSARVGQSTDWRPLVFPLVSTVVGLLMIILGYGVGGWLRGFGGLGLTLLLGSGGFSFSYLIVELLSTGSIITIEYALHKTLPGQPQSTVPVQATRVIHARLETSDCMELMETILSHRGTHLLSSVGALQ